jgi:hypothetical protein
VPLWIHFDELRVFLWTQGNHSIHEFALAMQTYAVLAFKPCQLSRPPRLFNRCLLLVVYLQRRDHATYITRKLVEVITLVN